MVFEKGYLNDLLWEKFNCIFNYGFNIGEAEDFERGHKKQDKIKCSEDKRFQTMPVLSAIIASASRDMYKVQQKINLNKNVDTKILDAILQSYF